MAKQLTEEAFTFLKQPENAKAFQKVAELLNVDLVTTANYMGRKKKVFSRHDIVEAVATAMQKKPSDIFTDLELKQESVTV